MEGIFEKIVLFSISSCILLILTPMVSSIQYNIVKEDIKEKYPILNKKLLLNRPILLIFIFIYIFVYLYLFFENYVYMLRLPLPHLYSFIIYAMVLIPYTFWIILITLFPFILDIFFPIFIF